MSVTFGKAQLSAGVASVVDYLLMLFLVEITGLFYVIAVALGALAGAVTNFSINRSWTFQSNSSLSGEIAKYAAVSGGSLLWNVVLVWGVTEFLGLKYWLSKILVSLAVALFWNYPLHKGWVFRRV